MAYLKGKRVNNDTIDPAKHKIVGMFRHPTFESFAPIKHSMKRGLTMCNCGQVLHSREAIHDHWQRGHFDEAIYEEYVQEKEGYVPTADVEDYDYSCDNFVCSHCAGMGYADYPSNRKPCPIPGHVERYEANFKIINKQMERKKRKWSVFDGPCPYCKKEEECEHWTGLGWTKNPPQKKHTNNP